MKVVKTVGVLFWILLPHVAIGASIRGKSIKGSETQQRELNSLPIELPDRKTLPPASKDDLRLPGSDYKFTPRPTTAAPTHSRAPSQTPSLSISPTTTQRPSSLPTTNPSSAPSRKPTGSPSSTPSRVPTTLPSSSPSSVPSRSPTAQPTPGPTAPPTPAPTPPPTNPPTPSPTPGPTPPPTPSPTPPPTPPPTPGPTPPPTPQPTKPPTPQPTPPPTPPPTPQPTPLPTPQPTPQPTKKPTPFPTPVPTPPPTATPSAAPSEKPVTAFYEEIGNNGLPNGAFPLKQCQGDCDGDWECEGNLICTQRDQDEPVAGCLGIANTAIDYCRNPNAVMESNPVVNDPNSFQLRLYWQSDYFWQETSAETWWCMECAKCNSFGLEDGDLYGCKTPGPTGTSCREGYGIWVRDCRDRSHNFRFNILRNNRSGDQIRVSGTNLCISTVERYLELRKCDSSKSRQLFAPITHQNKFELRPYNQRTWSENVGECVSQLHHPKDKEMVGLHQCRETRDHTTIYWQKYQR